MKRIGKCLAIVLLATTIVSFLPLRASANTAYKTYSDSPSGEFVETQTAYEAFGILSNEEMLSPEDLVVQDNMIYVVDSQTRQVIIMDRNGEVIRRFGEEMLSSPTGIALDTEGDIYVADSAAGRVFKFDQNGELLNEFARPEEPLFGLRAPYNPTKISVDIRGNMYIIGEGATDGVIQLNSDGQFLGYYGANQAPTNFIQVIRDTILSEIQQARIFRNIPPAPTNIDIDSSGIVYTVTNSSQVESVKKLNVAGENMLYEEVYQPEGAIDVASGLYNNFYVLTNEGRIIEYSSYGDLLFAFGARDSSAQRFGVYNSPSAIATDEQGTLYIADSEAQIIHMLDSTEFADEVHRGLTLFEDGRYIESEEYWENVLNMNSSFVLARYATGESYFQRQEYERALETFRIAELVPSYSSAFWEIRNQWFQNNLATWLFGLILLWIIIKALSFWHRKKGILKVPASYVQKVKNVKTVKESLLLFRMFRHPMDTLYEIQNMNRSSLSTATLLYIVLIIEFILLQYLTGFIFNFRLLDQMNIVLLVTIFIGVLVLFVGMNYLVSTITDGEGSLKDVYMGTIYSLAPAIVGLLPLTLISNVLTLNEAFLFYFSFQVMIAYSCLHLILMIKELHDFSGGEVVKNILLTVFSAIITVVVIYIIYILFIQVYDFIYSFILEVLTRV